MIKFISIFIFTALSMQFSQAAIMTVNQWAESVENEAVYNGNGELGTKGYKLEVSRVDGQATARTNGQTQKVRVNKSAGLGLAGSTKLYFYNSPEQGPQMQVRVVQKELDSGRVVNATLKYTVAMMFTEGSWSDFSNGQKVVFTISAKDMKKVKKKFRKFSKTLLEQGLKFELGNRFISLSGNYDVSYSQPSFEGTKYEILEQTDRIVLDGKFRLRYR